MREIKFRYYDPFNEIMIYQADRSLEDFFIDYAKAKRGGNNPKDPSQYTGLLDKHGQEIYEGDVFFYADDVQDKDGGLGPFGGEVVWIDDIGAWGWYPVGADKDMTTLMPASEDIEVIGNIYEGLTEKV